MHHQHGAELAENREPTQADQRIQPDIARPLVSPRQTEHGGRNVAAARATIQTGKVPLAPAAPMRENDAQSILPGSDRQWPYELDQFISDCRSILSRDPGPNGREAGAHPSRAAAAEIRTSSASIARKRRADCTCFMRTPNSAFRSSPTSTTRRAFRRRTITATSWAIYGQATHYTDMIEWEREDNGGDPEHAKLKPVKKYRLTPGHAGIYQDGKIHSIDYPDHSRFVRVTGTNLDQHPSRALRPEDRRGPAHDAAAGDMTGHGSARGAASPNVVR